MPELKGMVVTANQVATFYKSYPGIWFLLEVIVEKNKKAELLRVVGYDKNKDVLREYLLDEKVDIHRKYIFVFASPDGKCEI